MSTTPTKLGVSTGPVGAQRWRLLNGVSQDAALRALGATEIAGGKKDGLYYRYMVKVDGLWRYAHSDGTSCYISMNEGFEAPNGVRARIMFEHDGAVDGLRRAELALSEAKARLEELRSRLGLEGAS